ncbi:hypothetical protein SAMN05414139_04871 [Burkholderia sp. D7]|nr:hypothetical protein SAMN05414139_04871 [Burkholderia sp. D7]
MQWDEHTYPPRYSRRDEIFFDFPFARAMRYLLSNVRKRPFWRREII